MATAVPLSEPARSFQSLYRRYRPQRFSEVRGQDHVALALRNAVRDGRVAHAYLFSGPRGTGKTSTARILAKALNCTDLADGEPCEVCASCLAVTAGSSYDVHELDAASNNGVDAMRDLVARAALATPGSWKVYIVDEVHMLSTAASNALLKTLEEPPEHVVFVLATTDPQKVLPTIRSRTQHFEFHLIGEEVLGSLLADIATDAGLDLPDGAVGAAVRRAKGSARDALSALDQVATAGVVDDDRDDLAAIVTAMGTNDSAACLSAFDAAIRAGRDAQQLAVEIVERLRAGFLSLVGAGVAPGGVAVLSPAELEEVRNLGTARCVRAMELIGEAIVAMRDAPEPRITVEVALIRCTHPEADTSPDALVERIERLEHRLEALTASGATAEARPAPPPPPPLPPPLGETPRPAPPRRDGPPGPPASTDAATRPALGAFLRGDRPGATAPDTRGPDTRGPDTRGPDTRGPDRKGPDSAPLPVAEDVAPTARPTVEPVGASDDTRSTGGGEPPSYDELVTAWGDHILTGLRPKVRAIYQVGHFLPSSGGHALLALPNEAHILHAEPLKADVAAALASHFGRAVPLRLVVDPATSAPPEARSSVGGRGSRPSRSAEAGGAGSAPSESSESEEDLTDLGTPLRAEEEAAVKSSGIAWAEDRLLQAFPGAEEV